MSAPVAATPLLHSRELGIVNAIHKSKSCRVGNFIRLSIKLAVGYNESLLCVCGAGLELIHFF